MVLDLNVEEPECQTLEDELKPWDRRDSPHSHHSSDWASVHTIDVDEESSAGRDQRLTFTEVKAWSFGKLEHLTIAFLFEGLDQAIPVTAGLSEFSGTPSRL